MIPKELSIEREPPKAEKQPAVVNPEKKVRENSVESAKVEVEKDEKPAAVTAATAAAAAAANEESNGVGDKIKKFEKAAEDASVVVGRLSRPGSVRGRSRTERLGSDGKEDLPPPATPFKDGVHFDLTIQAFVEKTAPAAERSVPVSERSATVAERSAAVERSATVAERSAAIERGATVAERSAAVERGVLAERSVTVAERSAAVERSVSVERNVSVAERSAAVERQQSLTRAGKWQRADSSLDGERPKPEPQRIIKPEFKPMASPVDVTIRSPSLGAKIPDQFPSHGTAFRNVASPDPARPPPVASDDFKAGKHKPKEKYSVSKGSSYFTRGSEEIWLVKKKDIEEIEERVLDSFRRGEVRAASEAATLGRGKRQMYARSESLDPAWAGARAHTLKRQASVACTCGHDKKPHAARAKHAHAHAHAPAAHAHAGHAHDAPRPRSRSHGDDNAQAHVLDKYETLV